MTQSSIAPEADQNSSPTCAIIIPTRDKLEFLKPCIESILQSLTSQAIEILVVDNDSEDAASKDYLQSLDSHDNIKVLQWNYPFNFSAINNFAVQHTQAEVCCFLNNDIEITDPDWLDQMLAVARREDVGACGCVLLYPDRTIQHAGIALDEKAIARHIGVGETEDFLDTNGIVAPVSVVAVTAACLFVRRELFLRHHGFNEENLSVSFNDVDLCLRIREKGLPVMLHPAVKLIHHESVSRLSDQTSPNRPRALREYAYMQQRWSHRLKGQFYKSGLPDSLTAQVPLLEDLDKNVHMATDQLYREEPATPDPSATVDEESQSSLASQRATSFKELEERFKALQAHTHRIEEAHRLIESSVFWRITAPLRFLRDRLSAKKKKSEAEEETGTTTDTEQGQPGKPDETTSSKKEFDRHAQRKLDTFLASEKRLQFSSSPGATVSIVLVFFNRAALSLLCLQSLLEQVKTDYELIIIDNNSTDETTELLTRLDGVILEKNTDNLGFVKAVNQAAALASGKYLLLLNNDATVESGAVESAVQLFLDNDDIGAVGAKIKLLDGSLQEAGSIIWNDGACVGYGRGDDPLKPEYMMQRTVDYCSGAFLMVETRVFRELGCFDEQYAPAYYEESDFCIRLQQLGYRVVYDPGVQITHYEFASSGGIAGASKLQQAHREVLCKNHPVYLSKKYENDPANLLRARSANNYPNLLIIDDRVPFPSLGAGYPRCSHILNSLARMPVNLTFYPLLYPEDDWEEIHALLAPNIEVMLGKGMSGLPGFLKERQGFYKTIMVSRVHNMEIFNQALSQDETLIEGVELIYDAEAVSAPREVMQRRFWGESLSDEQATEMVRQELSQARFADKVVAVSRQEAEIYHQHDLTNTIVLGHMLPLLPTEKPFSKRKDLLFVGALRDEGSPNVDSLLWFLINCLPIIEQQIPGIRLIVIGDNTVPSLSTVTRDNVIFTGRIDSIDSYYNDCRVFIAPTRFAAGIPHKVHEAASRGIPSVTTSLLAQQLDWTNGQQLLSADNPQDFAQQCIRLHSDKKLWQIIRDEGLAAVERDCSEQVFRENLKQLFEIKGEVGELSAQS